MFGHMSYDYNLEFVSLNLSLKSREGFVIIMNLKLLSPGNTMKHRNCSSSEQCTNGEADGGEGSGDSPRSEVLRWPHREVWRLP